MLKIQDLKKSFNNKNILNGINICVEEGNIYGLIGRNGAGKTTLMNIVSGLLPKDSGEISTIDKEGKKVNIGFLPDVPVFFDYMKTGEYIRFLLQDRKNGKKKAVELLEYVGLKDDVKISTMSRGMRQRLGIAAVLVNEPEILLFDEPTSALDPSGRHELFDILLGLKDDGKSIILSTHILNDMEHVCDKVGFLHEGVIKNELELKKEHSEKILLELTFKDNLDVQLLLQNGMEASQISEKSVRIFLGEKLEQQNHVFDVLANLDREIVEIKNFRQSLDDIFREVCL